MTIPIKEILPREVDERIVPTLKLFTDLLDEFVNFGTHILYWDAHPKTNGEENIPPTMLFRHFLDLIDSVSILVGHGCGDTPKLLMRGALEVTLGIEYLFEKDTHDRAMAFLVVEILNEIKVLKKLNPKTSEGTQLHKILKTEGLVPDFKPGDKYNLEDEVLRKESILQLPQFQKAFKEYEQLKANKEANPKWYRFYGGPKNVEALSLHLNQKTLYELLYRKWSGAIHGSDVYLGRLTKNSEGGVDIMQLRFIKDVQEIVRYAMILSLKVFKAYIDNRIPEKELDRAMWYMTIREKYLLVIQTNMIIIE